MTTELRLLGGFECSVDGLTVDRFAGGAPARLLAYLALHRRTRHLRSHLAAVLWPDADDERARRRLSDALWSLRQTLERPAQPIVWADRYTIGLHPDAALWVDVDAFDAAVSAFERRRVEGTALAHLGSLQETLDLYRGELLRGLDDEWIDGPRQHVRERYLGAQRLAIDLERGSGRFDEAIVRARRLVDETPYAEESHLELVRLYWLSGRTGDALDQVERCRRILADELGVAPGPELQDLHRRIVREGADRVARGHDEIRPAAESTAMVGRTHERARLLALVDGAGAGAGGFAMVEGAAGMGKSRLLADVADAARWRGATVVWADHTVDRQLEPYGGIGRALDAAIGGLRREQVRARLDAEALRIVSRLLPGLRSPGDAVRRDDRWASTDERWRLQEGLVQVLLALAASSPTVVVIDDLHAADLDTVELLRLAAARTATGRLAVVIAYRRREAQARTDLWTVLTEIERHHRVTRLMLRPLAVAEIGELLAATDGLPAVSGLADRVHRATGGNPLFVAEAVRSVTRSLDRLGPTSTASSGEVLAAIDLEAPSSIERVVEVLVAELDAAPPLATAVVAALAVWARPASSDTIGALVGASGLDLLGAIGAAIDGQFVVETDDGYALRFGHLSVAAHEHTDPTRRVELHRRAAEELAHDSDASAAELARHHRAGASWLEAARHDHAAARHAARLHSYEVAAHHHALSLDSLGRADCTPTAAQLLDHERVLDILGRRVERSDVLDRLEALKELAAEDVVEVMSRRALLLADTDDMIGAIRQATAAVGYAVAVGLDWRPALVVSARVLIVAGHPFLANAHLRTAALDRSDDVGEGQAELALGFALADLAEWTAAAEHLHAALDRFREHGDSRGEVEALAAIAVLQSQTGASTALAYFDDAIGLARRIGHRYGEGMVLTNLAAVHQLQGNVAAALECSDQAIEVFGSIGQRRGEAIVRANAASLWHGVLGDDTRAEREASRARRTFEELSDDRRQAVCLDVLAGIRRRRRAFSLSRRLLTDGLRLLQGTGDVWLEVQILRSLAWTELESGRLDAARTAVDLAIERTVDAAIDIELPVLYALAGRIAAAAGDLGHAVTRTQQSLGAERDDADLGHLAAWWRHETLLATGRDGEALDQIRLAQLRLATMLEPFEGDRRDALLAAVPEHRRIAERHAATHVQERVVTLPAAGDDATVVEVLWTTHHPDDLAIGDKSDRRLHRIRRLLAEAEAHGGHARIRDLADALEASVATIKRDLASLRTDRALDLAGSEPGPS